MDPNSLDFLENLNPAPAAYISAVRRLAAESSTLQPLRLALCASFQADPLGKYLTVECARRGYALTPWFCPYNQFEIQAATPGSALFSSRPDVVVIATRLDDLVPELWSGYEAHSQSESRALVQQACGRVAGVVANIRANSAATVVVFNFSEPVRSPAGIRESPASLLSYANELLRQQGAIIFDFARLMTDLGLQSAHDAKLDYVSRMPFSVSAQIEIARRLSRFVRALHTPSAKCLALDLDNTLWGGVVGEVGPAGIELGNDYPGRVYLDFQRAVKALKNRGILLAIASKNNEADVREVFKQHPDMVLRWEDFAAVQIHWQDKAASLRAIAGHLNIGLDSLVFYDDNPVEREWVKKTLPGVTVIPAPEDLLHRVAALDACEALDQVTLSEEDRHRSALYERERRREQVRIASPDLSAFLHNLQIRVTIGAVNNATLPRVAQLINKTNQFNLTSRRYPEAELQQQLNQGAIGLWLRAADRFGDYGLVGAVFALPDIHGWRIDNFVLSCRILGRQVETALLAAIANRARESGGAGLVGEFLQTAKNAPARELYVSHGFQRIGEGSWIFDLSQAPLPVPDFLHIEVIDVG